MIFSSTISVTGPTLEKRTKKILAELNSWVSVMPQFDFDSVIEDGYIGINQRTAMMLAEIRGALIQHIYKLGAVNVERIAPTEAKKIATGNGRAKKEQVLEAVQARFPSSQVTTFDQADAIALGLAFMETKKK